MLQFPGVEYLQWQHDEITAELVTQDIKRIQEVGRLSEAQASAFAPVITPTNYEQPKKQWAKTSDERHVQTQTRIAASLLSSYYTGAKDQNCDWLWSYLNNPIAELSESDRALVPPYGIEKAFQYIL